MARGLDKPEIVGVGDFTRIKSRRGEKINGQDEQPAEIYRP
jgi:hypothetical protein